MWVAWARWSQMWMAVVSSPDSLLTIHTWDHLAQATHMKAGWVKDPQVALMILTLRAHMSI